MEGIIGPIGLILVVAIFVAPIIIAGNIATKRNRNKNKGQFVGLFTGWIGVALLWLGLKTRDQKTRQLY